MFDIDQSLLEEKYREIIKESPAVGGLSYGELLDNREYRIEKAQKLIKKSPPIHQMNIGGIDFGVYLEEGSNYNIYNFVSGEPELRSYFLLKDIGSGVQSGGVWQRHQDYGLAREIVFDYILKEWDYFISDSMQYVQGEKFWRKLLERAEKENFKVAVIDKRNNEEINFNKLKYDEYSGRDKYFANFLFKLYSKS